MKIYKVAKDVKQKMKEWYEKRTKAHITLVQKYCKKISTYDKKYEPLIERGKIHDQSKFEDPEIDPYIYITWKYKCEDDGLKFEDCKPPEDMDDQMHEATFHHIKNNKHHPECHADEVHLNKEDRDKAPDKMVDGTKMKDVDIGEMVADWCAMSKEKGGTPKSWADKNVNIRWEFTDEQADLIYELIDFAWEK